MTIKSINVNGIKVTHCKFQCPHYKTEMSVMYCSHPKSPDSGYIISNPIAVTGFPNKCPLFVQE